MIPVKPAEGLDFISNCVATVCHMRTWRRATRSADRARAMTKLCVRRFRAVARTFHLHARRLHTMIHAHGRGVVSVLLVGPVGSDYSIERQHTARQCRRCMTDAVKFGGNVCHAVSARVRHSPFRARPAPCCHQSKTRQRQLLRSLGMSSSNGGQL